MAASLLAYDATIVTNRRSGLSIAEQQIVEIAKALSLDARVIVMDEPTAALSAVEVDRLFSVIGKLRADGAAVLFISHRLEEVFAICQRATVMRDGRHVLTSDLAGLTAKALVRAMVGRALARIVESSDPMNTGNRIPHTIRCASRWVSGSGSAGTGVAASIDFSLHFQDWRAALEKRGGCAYLPDALGRASDSSPSDDAAGAGFGYIPQADPFGRVP